MIFHFNMGTFFKFYIHLESLELFNQIRFFCQKYFDILSFLTLGDEIWMRQNMLIENIIPKLNKTLYFSAH